MKFSVTGTTSILMNVDTTINSGIGNANEFPAFEVIVDDAQPVLVPLTSGATQLTLATGMSSGITHTVVLYAVTPDPGINMWSATTGQTHVQSLQFANGSTLSAYPTVYSKNCLMFGDSYWEPYYGQPYTSGTTPVWTVTTPSYSVPFIVGRAVGCEVGVIGIGGQGYTQTGGWSYPVLGSSWNYYDSTHSKTFSPAPDYVVIEEGINDHGVSLGTMQTAVQSLLTALRSAFASTKIFQYIPTGGEATDETGTGGANATPIRNAVTAQADANVFPVDTGTQLVCANNWSTTPTGCPSSGAGPTWFNSVSGDALHPAQTTQGVLAGYAIEAIQKAIGGRLVAYSTSN